MYPAKNLISAFQNKTWQQQGPIASYLCGCYSLYTRQYLAEHTLVVVGDLVLWMGAGGRQRRPPLYVPVCHHLHMTEMSAFLSNVWYSYASSTAYS